MVLSVHASPGVSLANQPLSADGCVPRAAPLDRLRPQNVGEMLGRGLAATSSDELGSVDQLLDGLTPRGALMAGYPAYYAPRSVAPATSAHASALRMGQRVAGAAWADVVR